MDNKRKGKLHWFFNQTIQGEQQILTPDRAKRFLEAICSENDIVTACSRIITSSHGLAALRQATRIDVSLSFFNTSIRSFFEALHKPELVAAFNGSILHTLLGHLVDPPVFWHEFVRHAENGTLSTEALHSFTWLLLQFITSSDDHLTILAQTSLTSPMLPKVLQNATSPEIRNTYQKISLIASTLRNSTTQSGTQESRGPGGRHDNDLQDFRKVALLPTVDELTSTDPPFLRFAAELDNLQDQSQLLATHLDNQFRLLREDMVRDIREELQGNNKRRAQRVDGLKLVGIQCDGKERWALVFDCLDGLWFMPKGNPKKRLDFLQTHKKVFSHGSVVCIIADGVFVGLGLLWRKEDSLAQANPQIHIHLPGAEISSRRTLAGLRGCSRIQIVQLNTALFAYEPVLKQLQNIRLLPLADSVMSWRSGTPIMTTSITTGLELVKRSLELDPSCELRELLELPHSTQLDLSQARSLMTALTQDLAIVQGPPGTGKSFLGALVAKALYKLTDYKILVLSYTNHALDQYLEDLMSVNIAASDIVRLGSLTKASDKTKVLVQSAQTHSQYKMTRTDWAVVDNYRKDANATGQHLVGAFQDYNKPSVTRKELMDFLEFSPDFDNYFDAFQSPTTEEDDDFRLVGKDGKSIDQFYLLDRWMRGKDAGVFRDSMGYHAEVWRMSPKEREATRKLWLADMFNDRITRVIEHGSQYNTSLAKVDVCFGERGRRLLKNKRVIGCTTTAAAKYVDSIQSARPDVIIVEEAGEILESHVLTAIGPETRQLILIGDHRQLRPKAHYDLSVEKGTGYDLNRSLFERLVLKGYPHETLSEQHRMRPEISALVRNLTYPELTDAPKTKNRQNIRGLQDNLIFVNHAVIEDETEGVFDPREGGFALSKTNLHEATMTLRCVRYLAQQGYGSDQIVVLTPYLGQLRLLVDVLQSENDPVLNDLDTFDLVKAGLMSQATAGLSRRRLRISTIDNYQGEESDIVIVSLTRSNERGDIGFLASPERLNVLLSRARDGLILLGNASTFTGARKGKDLWVKFMSMLTEGLHIYDGLPVHCERHLVRKAVLAEPKDFDAVCPDGGCDAPCGVVLNCGMHKCPQKCHQLYDHSKMRCEHIMSDTCNIGHAISWKCADKRPAECRSCEYKRKSEERRKVKEHERRVAEALAQLVHDEKMASIDQEIETIRQQMKFAQADENRRHAYEQKLEDLQNARKNVTATPKNTKSTAPSSVLASADSHVSGSTPDASETPAKETTSSATADEWEQMKELDGVSNNAIDTLVQMTGLESVKRQFLDVLQKIQTSQRQGIGLQHERLGTVLLGNPGTGKTTVARLYAKFLTEVGVLPGSKFVETTGAKLANEGVSGTKKMLDSVLEAGGGAVLVDEAYQLVSGGGWGGGGVLDFLLAEIENTTGKVAFMFAGYEKQMEKFFQHNPGLISRMPHQMKFADYTEAELLHMLQQKIVKRFKGKMTMAGGPGGLYMRIVVRRLHRGSGREGFGNARALENVLDKVTTRQSTRLTHFRRSGSKPNDFHLTKEDLIGPEPSGALTQSLAWKKLREMTGLDAVKQTVQTLLDRLQDNYQRELKEQPPIEVSLNKLFLGSPGTGKTTVAKLYGQILAEIGVLSTSECVVKTPADFIGSVIGESEKNTKAILENTKGKVLVIDEAYMLCSNLGDGPSTSADPYRTAVVDTIVSEVHSAPGEDRAVLLLGYEEQMKDMLHKVNPGLTRRFPIESAFLFEDYNDEQLLSILDHKLDFQGLTASDQAKTTAINVLSKLRRRRNFGNAGEVENLLSRAKDSFAKRQQSLPPDQRPSETLFEPQDFDADFARAHDASENCEALFQDVVGSDDVVAKLKGYIKTFENAEAAGMNPEDVIPFNFVFKGPPGTCLQRPIGSN